MVETNAPVNVADLMDYARAHLIVADLKLILKSMNLPSTGLKKVLQEKLFGKMRELERTGDTRALQLLQNMIMEPKQNGAGTSMRQSSYASSASSSNVGGYNSGYTSYPATPQRPVVVPTFNQHYPPRTPTTDTKFTFKPSPFYTVVDSLSAVVTVPLAQHTRSTLRTNIALTSKQLEQLKMAGSDYRVLLFCAEYSPGGYAMDHIVAFPQQCEIKVGDNAVQANTRGLRKQVGTTKPVDLTSYMTFNGQQNMLFFTYALTKQVSAEELRQQKLMRYAYVVRLVRNVGVPSLVKKLQEKQEYISKQSVLDSMRKANEESDLVATASNMPLRCPLSTLRIQMPIRSKNCTHNQCVDATSYLELQTQAPTWKCPICNKPSPYELLVIDKYVQDILDSTPKDVESVRVDPDGNWSIESRRAESIDSDSEDEKVPIKVEQPRFVTKGPYTPDQRRTSSQFATPQQPETPLGVLNGTNGTNGTQSAGQKRTHDVIDLTLSDDDEPPPRPQKRVNDNPFPTPNSHRDSSVAQYSGGAGLPYHNGALTETHPPLRFQLPSVNNLPHYQPPPPPPSAYIPPPPLPPPQLQPPRDDAYNNWQPRDYRWDG